MTTERRDPQVVFQGLSVGNMTVGSVVGQTMFNAWSINHGFTVRRNYNTTSVTTAQLAEVVATLIEQLFKQQ